MAFNDTYRESIQSKHISNVGFSSTAKGVTNEGYTLKNPHNVIATQIPTVNVVDTYGPLVASGIAAGLVEKYTVKLTADPTVNNNKAWLAYADDCIETTHSGAAHTRLDQWMRVAETQYKLRLFEDNGANAPDYSAEIFSTEGTFNWEYDPSAGVVYTDEDPALNGKTLPLWGELYLYIGETIADKIDTTVSGVSKAYSKISDGINTAEADSGESTISFQPAGGISVTVDPLTDSVTISGSSTFVGSDDTPSVYEDGSLIFSTTTDINYATELNWDDITKKFSITSSGSLGFTDNGTYINEFSTDTTLSGNSDDAIPTEKAVKAYVDDSIGDLQSWNVDLTKNGTVWEYDGSFTVLPNNIVVYYNGVRNKSNDAEYYTSAIVGGKLQITFSFATYSTDWVTVTFGNVPGGVNVGGGSGLSDWVIKIANYTSSDGDRIIVDTSADGSNSTIYTITLPLNPSFGDEVSLVDGGYNCTTTKVIVDRNSQNIMGSATDMDINVNGADVELMYYNSTRGWILK